MKLGSRFLVLSVLLAVILSPFSPVTGGGASASTERTAGLSANLFVENGDASSQSMDSAVDFRLLKVVSYLWSDGHGDMSLEHIVKNNSANNFTGIIWLLDDWNTTDYRNIRAEDDKGPLNTSTRMDGTNIYITIFFRQAVPIGQSLHFTLYVTIGKMTTGSGNNWNGHWYIRVEGSPIGELIQGVTLPSNAQITSVTPTPTTRRNNYVEWRYINVPDGWQLTIDLNYQLSSTMNVPLFYQGTAPVDGNSPVWELDTYNNYPAGDRYNTMYAWGCFITSGAMVINYWAQKLDVPFRTDPRQINEWMKTHRGYDAGHNGNVNSIVEYARYGGVTIYAETIFTTSSSVLDGYILSGKPVMLGVRNQGHFVVATGITTVGGVKTYTINDPLLGSTTLKESYNNQFSRMTVFTDTPVDNRDMRVAAHSPVEFVVTDRFGRKSGYDPTTGTTWNQIPNSHYVLEGLARAGTTTPENISKVLYINEPEDGNYDIKVFGIGSGLYKVDTFATDWKGEVDYQIVSGEATVGSVATYTVEYNAVAGIIFKGYLPMALRNKR
ncbi:MAG: C39 family peptidase [Patescibacteria group bacterium]